MWLFLHVSVDIEEAFVAREEMEELVVVCCSAVGCPPGEVWRWLLALEDGGAWCFMVYDNVSCRFGW